MKDLGQFVKKSNAARLFKIFHEAVMNSLTKFDTGDSHDLFIITGNVVSGKIGDSKEADLIHYLLIDSEGKEFFRHIIFNLSGFEFRNVDLLSVLDYRSDGTKFYFTISFPIKQLSLDQILKYYRHSVLYKTFEYGKLYYIKTPPHLNVPPDYKEILYPKTSF